MNLSKKIRIGGKMALVRLLGRRIPITVGWDITNKCNLRCQYCRQPLVVQDELDESTALRVAHEMAQAGVEVVTFSGGEPLMRPDIAGIAGVLVRSGVYLSLNTNGVLIDSRREVVRQFDHVKISLDGDRAVHDRIRGEGVFDKALRGLDCVISMSISASLGTVLSSANVERIDEVFRIAHEYHIPVLFQPIAETYAHGHPIDDLIPTPDAYKRAVEFIIEEKRRNNGVVNSFPGLEYLKTYPDSPTLRCYGGMGIGRISADGTLVPCVTMRHRFFGKNLKKSSFNDAFLSIPRSGCRTCYCSSTLDFNLLLKPDVRTFRSFARRID